MRHGMRIGIAVLVVAGIALLAVPRAAEEAAAAPPGAVYEVDPVHTCVHFRVQHLSAGIFQGRFNEASGRITWNEADPSKSTVRIEVQAGSVDTRTERLDGHIKSPDFLSAAQFPVITFESKSFKKVGTEAYDVTGDFTLRGVKKEITVRAQHNGTSEIHGKRIGFSTTFTINRRDFNVNYGEDKVVGDRVTLVVDVEAVQPE